MSPADAARAALAGVAVVYCAEEAQARRLLGEMLAADRVAIDIETAPNKTEADRLAGLLQRKAEAAGQLKAARKLKASAAEIATLAGVSKRLTAEIRYAKLASLDSHRARIRLMQVYAGGDNVLVIDLDKTGAGVLALIDGVNVIAHNISFELAFLEAAGVALGELQCTMQATRLVLGEHAMGLAAAARAYLNLDLDKTLQTSDWSAPVLSPEQIDYAAIDAVIAWRIAAKILPRFDVQKSAYEIQLAAVPAAMRMESHGFKLDVEAHARLIADLSAERITTEQEYREACRASDHTALIDKVPSTQTQKEAMLSALLSSDELERWRRTEKSGALSTRRSELMRAGHYPPIVALAKLSRIDKMLSSFGQTLAALVSPVTGRIHAHYRIAGTASGRASCAGPNLQQVPRDPRFRALFVPEPGNVFVIADYGSMELRAAAYISGDHAMTNAFEQGLDLHRMTAARMTGKDPAEVTSEERKGAKCVNFGSIYGQGAGGLVQAAWDQFDLVLDFEEAKAWLKAFESAYWGLVQWRRIHYKRCEGRRYIVIGRDIGRGIGRIYPQSRVPEGGSYYTRCCNLPIQGACADASMLALSLVDDRLFDAGIEGGPVAWLHDEIVLEVRADQAVEAAAILKQAMIDGFIETFPDAPIDGLVEPHIGMSWAEKDGAEKGGAGKDGAGNGAAMAAKAPIPVNVSAEKPAPPAPKPGSPAASLGFYEFFAGGGMARSGLGPHWTNLLANDNNYDKAWSYARNFGRAGLTIADVAHLTTASLPGRADLVHGSPPCVGASLAGGRKGLGDEAWAFLRLMQGLRAEGRAPRMITIENVPDMLTSLGGADFDRTCNELTTAGYVYGAMVVDAALFVPQSRERLFVIAVDAGLPILSDLVAAGPAEPFHPPSLVKAMGRQKAKPIWFRLPIPPPHGLTLADIIDGSGMDWNPPAKTAEIISMMEKPHLDRLARDQRAGKLVVRGLNWRTRGKITRWESRPDLIANCLRTASGGSSIQTLMFVDGDNVRTRRISPAEYARAMGLDADYELPTNHNAVYNLIGDGVCPPVIRFLAQHILEPVLAASLAMAAE
jgi:DNA (cytosine-5)-methyltransferase 1